MAKQITNKVKYFNIIFEDSTAICGTDFVGKAFNNILNATKYFHKIKNENKPVILQAVTEAMVSYTILRHGTFAEAYFNTL